MDVSGGLSQDYLNRYDQAVKEMGIDPNPWNIHSQSRVGDYLVSYNAAGDILGRERVSGDTTTSTGGTSTGGGSTPNPLNEAAIANTRKAIDSLGTEEEVGRKNIGEDYSSLVGKYERERTRNKGDYDTGVVTNTQNLTKNKQNALLAAAQGRRGLRGTLASLGALGGTGSFLADRAVTTGANQDIGEASETFAGNAQNLDKAWKRFDEEDDERRAEARSTRENNETALEGTIATKRQNFYQKMAELFADAEQNDEARTWLNRAGDLNEIIAQKTRVRANPFSAKAALYTPGELAKYLAGAGDMTVAVGGGAPSLGGPSSILAGRRRREDEERAV